MRWVLRFDPPLSGAVIGIHWTVKAPDAHPIDGSFNVAEQPVRLAGRDGGPDPSSLELEQRCVQADAMSCTQLGIVAVAFDQQPKNPGTPSRIEEPENASLRARVEAAEQAKQPPIMGPEESHLTRFVASSGRARRSIGVIR